jgi:hypothetical protein
MSAMSNGSLERKRITKLFSAPSHPNNILGTDIMYSIKVGYGNEALAPLF